MALSKIKANSITDDSITADQIADNAVHGRRNLIINGAMKVAQRATSATTVSGAGVYDTIDRLKLWESTGGAWTSEQSTEAPDGFEFSTKLACTTADTSIGAAEYAGFGQTIEANDLAHLAYGTSSAKPITVSFYIRSNKTGTYCLAVDKNDNTSPLTSYNFVKEFTIDSADTWERKVITVQPDSQIKASAGAIAIDNGVGFQILVGLAWGSDYSGATDNTWSSSDLYATNNQVNWLDSTSNNLYFTGFQVEVGDKATPFEHRSYGEELALCQRYFHNTAPTGGSQYLWAFPIAGASQTFRRLSYVFPTTMRANPALVDGVGGVAGGSLQANKPTVESGWEGGTVVNLDLQSASDSAYCWFQSGGFDAEL